MPRYRHQWEIERLNQGWRHQRGIWFWGNISGQSSCPGPCRRTPPATVAGGLPGQDLFPKEQRIWPNGSPGPGAMETSLHLVWNPTVTTEIFVGIPELQQHVSDVEKKKYKKNSAHVFCLTIGVSLSWWSRADMLWHRKWKMTLRGISRYVRYTCALFSRAQAASLVQSLKWHGASLTLICPCRCKVILNRRKVI